jgi:hypothetical protein
MKKLMFLYLFLSFSFCFAQNNNPSPPFADIYRKPNVHPYTYLGPFSNALDYQQMFYLEDKYNSMNKDVHKNQVNRKYAPHINNSPGIRPTGHKSYFMNIP